MSKKAALKSKPANGGIAYKKTAKSGEYTVIKEVRRDSSPPYTIRGITAARSDKGEILPAPARHGSYTTPSSTAAISANVSIYASVLESLAKK